jgi:hypothetical protein
MPRYKIICPENSFSCSIDIANKIDASDKNWIATPHIVSDMCTGIKSVDYIEAVWLDSSSEPVFPDLPTGYSVQKF